MQQFSFSLFIFLFVSHCSFWPEWVHVFCPPSYDTTGEELALKLPPKRSPTWLQILSHSVMFWTKTGLCIQIKCTNDFRRDWGRMDWRRETLTYCWSEQWTGSAWTSGTFEMNKSCGRWHFGAVRGMWVVTLTTERLTAVPRGCTEPSRVF